MSKTRKGKKFMWHMQTPPHLLLEGWPDLNKF